MTLRPGYGQTPVDPDEVTALVPGVRELLGEPVTKAAVYDLEQGIQVAIALSLTHEVLGGRLAVESILTDHFLRDLHGRLYEDVWVWAGTYRRRDRHRDASDLASFITTRPLSP